MMVMEMEPSPGAWPIVNGQVAALIITSAFRMFFPVVLNFGSFPSSFSSFGTTPWLLAHILQMKYCRNRFIVTAAVCQGGRSRPQRSFPPFLYLMLCWSWVLAGLHTMV